MADSLAPAAGKSIDYAQTLTSRQKWVILFGLMITLFLAALDGTIVATAQPSIVRQFQAIDLISWVTSGYLLANTAMVPILGKLSDLYGRKIIIMTSTVVFLLGSALSGAAPSMVYLILARVVQGMGAAGITAISFAVIADMWVPAERAQISGFISSVFGLAGVVGPFVGGWLTDHVSWRAVFYVNLPIGVIALIFVALKMPSLARGIKAKVDWAGVFLMLVTVIPFMLALTLDRTDYPWTSPFILALFGVAALGLVLFLVVESRVAQPLLPLHLFANRTFSVVAAGSLLFGGAFFGSIIYLAIFLVGVNGVSATKAGSTLMPMMLGMVVGSVVTSILAQRTGRYKPFILLGMFLVPIGLYFMSTMTADTTLGGVTWRMVFLGVAVSPVMPLLGLAITNAVSMAEMGVATSTRSFFQSIGQTLAVSIFGVILTTNLTHEMDARFQAIRAQVPPAFASKLDTAQMRNQVGGGGDSGTPDLGATIAAEVEKAFDAQRTLVTKAIRDADPAAMQALNANPLTPEQMKPLLMPGALDAMVGQQMDAQFAQLEAALKSGNPDALKAILANPQTPDGLKQGLAMLPPEGLKNPQALAGLLAQAKQQMAGQKAAAVAAAREQALKGALAGLDQAEATAVQQGQSLGVKIARTLKETFAAAVTPVYRIAMVVAGLAFVIMLLLPEIPLRRGKAPVVGE
ncbi:MAG TPA: MDR family MFS transporter [Symbiobacteriaceae bacterium]|jgi:EmrB/QacA subfamily drug resistance transporter